MEQIAAKKTDETTKKDGDSRPTRLAVDLVNGRAQVTTLEQGYFLGGRIMQNTGSHIRLAVVGIHMPLLGGDNVTIQIRVGPGVTLEIIEPSGMVAYDADGESSDWRLDAKVGTGATLIWHGKEFVAAKGSDAHRSTKIELETGARTLFKETLVLGRSGETNVRLNSRIQALLEGKELLTEELSITPETRRLPGIISCSKVISTVTALGIRPDKKFSDTQCLDLAGPGALWRSLAPAAHEAEKATGPVFRGWRQEILKQSGFDRSSNNSSHISQ